MLQFQQSSSKIQWGARAKRRLGYEKVLLRQILEERDEVAILQILSVFLTRFLDTFPEAHLIPRS